VPPASDEARGLRAHLQGVWVCALLGVVVAILAGRALGLARNTIETNGRWRVSKSELEIPILGAQSFYSGRQALAGGALDLGAWHGFQQVVYRGAVELDALELDFRLTGDSYLVVLFGGTESGDFLGLRLSHHAGFSSAFLEIAESGEFRRKEPLEIPPLEPESLHHLRLELGSRTRALLDGEPIGAFEAALPERQWVGLRGGYSHVFVDSVVLKTRPGPVIRESFDLPPDTAAWTLLLALALVALPAALAGLLRWRGEHLRRALLALAAGELMAVAVLAAAQPLAARVARGYPTKDAALVEVEETARREALAAAVERTQAAYPVPVAENSARLVFVGSSQTVGVGARRVEEGWVSRIERRLNASDHGGLTWECVNAGVSSARSNHLLPAVQQAWSRLGARALIFDLASNDGRLDVFADRLTRMVTSSLRRGVTPVLVLEPNSPEVRRRPLQHRHAAARAIGAKHAVSVIDMQTYLDERYDEGFLWWDHVHLTSFGQRLMAAGVYSSLVELGIVPQPAGGRSAQAPLAPA
jgi:lysophospholipase L1-like esterase